MSSSTAWVGVVGALVGGLLNYAGTTTVARWQAKREAQDLQRRLRAAARMLMDDCYNTQTALAHTVRTHMWWPANLGASRLAQPEDVRLLVAEVDEPTSRRILGAHRRRLELERARSTASTPLAGPDFRMRALVAFIDLDEARGALAEIGGMAPNPRALPRGVTPEDEREARETLTGP